MNKKLLSSLSLHIYSYCHWPNRKGRRGKAAPAFLVAKGFQGDVAGLPCWDESCDCKGELRNTLCLDR